MTIPGSLILEAAPYGAVPVVPCIGPQGGPYTPRGPSVLTLLPSAARVATLTTGVQINTGYRGLYLASNVTVNPGGAQTLAYTLISYLPVSGATAIILTVAASATPGGIWLLFPGASGAAVEGVGITRNLVLPYAWAVTVTHSGAGSWTYDLGATLLP